MKYNVTECDICGKDISGYFQYRFRYWHGRTGTIHKLHMCEECLDKFKEFVKKGEVDVPDTNVGNNWTPVSQQEPPKEGRPVLVTMLDYEGKRFVTETLDKRVTKENKVIAWQYPPDVYKGEI